jgi:poly(3-hydroxybutyrate) depolymerase
MAQQRRVPMIVFHGDEDDTVHVRNSAHVIEQAWPEAKTLLKQKQSSGRVRGGHRYTHTSYLDQRGQSVLEMWEVHGSGHAWSGGDAAGSYTDPLGPDASREMMRFFLSHRLEPVAALEDAAD